MSEPRSVHNISEPPKGPPSCHGNAPDEEEQVEPCGPYKSRQDGSPERYRQLWHEFYDRHPPNLANIDPELAADLAYISAGLVEALLPPPTLAALEARLGLGALASGRVRLLRLAVSSMEADVAAVDASGVFRFALAPLITPQDLGVLVEVMRVLEEWDAKRKAKRKAARARA